jgi:membrane-associated phospholipid phosphatase
VPVRRSAAAAAAAGLALVVLTVAVRARDPLPGEEDLLRRWLVRDGRWRDLWEAVATATDLLPLVVLAGLAALGLAVLGRWREALVALGACVVVWLVNPVLKSLVARSRPDVVTLPEHLSEHSFPSGHAANSAVVVGAALLVLARLRRGQGAVWPLVGAGLLVLVAAAQLALGRHYPSDVLAGWLLAAAIVTTAAMVVPRRSDDSG